MPQVSFCAKKKQVIFAQKMGNKEGFQFNLNHLYEVDVKKG